MKTERRHDLETNELAKRISHVIERVRPYATTAVTAVLIVVAAVLAFNYSRGFSKARQEQAWEAYNMAVEGNVPKLDELKQAAEQHAGTTMQKWADVTWADGQVFMATRAYLSQRQAANAALDRASSAYQTLIRSADDPRIVDRARFGLARVYEMRGELEQARAEYERVQGEFAVLAEARAEQLAKERTQEAYAWLATAEPPPPPTVSGPGTPGERPEFEAGDLEMPADDAEPSFDDLLERLQRSTETPESDRYDPESEAVGQATIDDVLERTTVEPEMEQPAEDDEPEHDASTPESPAEPESSADDQADEADQE